MLWSADRFLARAIRSSEGQTVEIDGPDGARVAAITDDGRVTRPDGTLEVTLPLRSERPAHLVRPVRGTELLLAVDFPGAPGYGYADVTKYGLTPMGKRIEFDLHSQAGCFGRLEPTDRKGEHLLATAGDTPLVRATVTDRDRGLTRSVTTWEIELPYASDDAHRRIALAAVLRYPKVLARLAEIVARDRR